MIIVTLGTIDYPFNRVVIWLRTLLESNLINEPVLFQHGKNSVKYLNHPLLTNVASLTGFEMQEYIRQSSFVISHAGQGSTRMLAKMGKGFVLIPRLKRYGEHIDDHQLLFAQQVAKYGIHYCTELEQLVKYIQKRPLPYKGELFKAPLLVEYLIHHYQELETTTQIKATK